ncbi:MAG: hypothetical protein NTW86_19105, partial [Candidatus Sumerlaeota bacterium]|nr:hypothetical protein [Candidatus Sumerlaeota bacterium]
VVAGMILNRFDVCIVTFQRPADMPYVPAWQEIAVSLGIVAGAALVFIFFVENLRIYESSAVDSGAHPVVRPRIDPAGFNSLSLRAVGAPRVYSLMALLGAALAVAMLPAESIFGSKPLRTPVYPVRAVEGVWLNAGAENQAPNYVLAGLGQGAPAADAKVVPLQVLDGNRDGRLVLFSHEGHIKELTGDQSCVVCHHENLPFDENTACGECHRDMYEPTDIFDHETHVEKLHGADSCLECHADAKGAKTRATAAPCETCHGGMLVDGSFLAKPANGMTGMAPGYKEAMHGLCIGCHDREAQKRNNEAFSRCDECHRDVSGADLRKIGPYAPRKSIAAAAAMEATK